MVHFILAIAMLLTLIGSMKHSKQIFLLAFLFLFVFAAQRYMFGNDYVNYYQIHSRIINGGISPYKGEYLFTLLNALTPSFFYLIILTSAFFLFSVYRLLLRNLPIGYAWIGVFIFLFNPYLFLMNLSAIRQCIAMVFFIFAVDAAYKKRWLKYFILLAVAALFHKSAWLLLPLYFFIDDRPVNTYGCWLTFFFVLLLVYVIDLSDLIVWTAKLFNDPNYLSHVQTGTQNSLRATLLTSIYFIYVLYNLPRLSGKTLVYSKVYLIATILGMLAYKMSMFTRIQMYFDIFSIIALPLIFYDIQSRGPVECRADRPLATMWDCVNKYAIPVLLVTVYLLRYYSFFTNPMWRSFFEYQTIFSTL